MSLYLWIAVGSALGGVARFAVAGIAAEQFGPTFPWGTLIVNVTGSFIIGFFATLTAPEGRWLAGTSARHFVATGILGGFTTYSSFSLQTLMLVRAGDWARAGANAAGTFVLCFVAVWLGHVCAMWLNSLKGA